MEHSRPDDALALHQLLDRQTRSVAAQL
jgi:hypothetical protein